MGSLSLHTMINLWKLQENIYKPEKRAVQISINSIKKEEFS